MTELGGLPWKGALQASKMCRKISQTSSDGLPRWSLLLACTKFSRMRTVVCSAIRYAWLEDLKRSIDPENTRITASKTFCSLWTWKSLSQIIAKNGNSWTSCLPYGKRIKLLLKMAKVWVKLLLKMATYGQAVFYIGSKSNYCQIWQMFESNYRQKWQ